MLYYPHYTPSKQRLRSILLFSDTLSLIVPSIDQYGVRNRANIRDLFEFQPDLIDFKDPQHRYDGWANRKGIDKIVASLVKEVENDIEDEGLDTITKDQFGQAKRDQDELISHLWSAKGWKYVAAEKFPSRIHNAIFQSAAAARVGIFRNPRTGDIVEHNGVLCHPKLADFVLSRMAREASFKEGIPSITFGGIDYFNHLFDGESAHQSRDHLLLQSSIDLLVPDNLELLDTAEYLAIRSDYSDLRHSIWSYLTTISSERNLHLDWIETDALLRNLSHAREQIIKDLDQVSKFVGRQRFRSRVAFALEAASTLGGAAIGAAFSDQDGAMIGAGVGLVGGKLAAKLSTVQETRSGRLMSIAMAKARVEKSGARKEWNAPSYWMD